MMLTKFCVNAGYNWKYAISSSEMELLPDRKQNGGESEEPTAADGIPLSQITAYGSDVCGA
jgi:hypothetical protein